MIASARREKRAEALFYGSKDPPLDFKNPDEGDPSTSLGMT